MNRVETHICFLRYLSVTTSYQRRNLLQTATTEQLNVLYEIAFNILQGNISLTSEDYTRLYKNKNVLRKLALKEIDKYTKRQLLGKYSCAIKELLTIFFHYYSPKSGKKSLSELSCVETDEKQNWEEEEEEESISKLSASEVDTESEDDGPERVQDINPYTTFSIPSTAKAASEPVNVKSSEPAKSTECEASKTIE